MCSSCDEMDEYIEDARMVREGHRGDAGVEQTVDRLIELAERVKDDNAAASGEGL